MVFQPMTILDISIGGVQDRDRVRTPARLRSTISGSRCGDRSVVVKGRIAHCNIGELTEVAALYRTGVEFVELSDHARSAITDFVIATKYLRARPPVIDGEIAGDGETR